MPTVNANLFVDNAGNTLLYNQLGGTPALPALNAGDTLALQVFYFDRGSGGIPFRCHRYAGSTTRVRLRAAGNNTIYADNGAGSSEIVPTTGATVVRTQAGGSFVDEKQSVTFPVALFLTGTFKIGFSGAGSGGRGGGVSLEGTTAAIPVTASAADVLAAILAVRGFYKSNAGPYTFAELSATFGPQATQPVVTGTPSTGFVVEFGSLYGGSNYWNTGIHLLTIDDSDVNYPFGWSTTFLLSGAGHPFNDLFLTANAPAYLEVLLTPSGGSAAFAAQYLLVSSGGSGGDPPPPPPGGGGGGPGGADLGPTYVDGDFTVAKAVDVVRVEQPFPQTPSAKIYRQPYWQMDSFWSPLALDSACPYDGAAGLVEESPQQSVGGARIVSWERCWATVPPSRIEYEMLNYIWLITGTIGGAAAIASYNLYRRAKVTHTYIRTADASSIPLARLPRAVVFGGVFTILDGYVNLAWGTETIARDDTLERWMGNIWHKTHTTIVI